MSLNNIHLDPALLAGMYKTALVETNEPVLADNKKQTSSPGVVRTSDKDVDADNSSLLSWKYLGDYKKNILIIVRYNDVPHLPDEQLNFLTSVLNACKLSLGDVAILNVANASFSHKALQEKFKSKFVILLGLTPEALEMPLSFPEFQVQAFNNCIFLHTPALEVLGTDKILKSKLWVSLRKMFGV